MPYTTFNINKTLLREVTVGDGTTAINLYIPSTNDLTLTNNETIVSKNIFLKSLRAYTKIRSIIASDLPNFQLEDSESVRLAKVLDIEWNRARIHLDLLLSNDDGDNWHTIGTLSLINNQGYPYRSHNLLDLYTDNLALELGVNSTIGCQLKDVGWGVITNQDKVIISGAYSEEYVIRTPEAIIFNNNFSPSSSGSSSGSGGTNPVTPTPIGFDLIYSFNGDNRGLIYYLGSNKRTTTFSNPATTTPPLITVTNFQQYQNFIASNATDRDDNTRVTYQGIGASWSMDLGENKKLICTGYYFKGVFNETPKRWRLESRNSDFDDWVVVHEQTTVMNWSGNSRELYTPVSGQTLSYRKWNLVITDNSENGSPYSSLIAVEFYGKYIET